MKQKLLRVLALVAVMLVSTSVYAQTLTLGDFDNADIYTDGTFFGGDSNDNAPFEFIYQYSASQTIYPAIELKDMVGKEITTIKFKCGNLDSFMETYSSSAKLYLTEVDNSEFVKDADGKHWFNFDKQNPHSTAALEFSPVGFYEGNTEIIFNLTTPFLYSGKNLVITVVNDAVEAIPFGEHLCFYKQTETTNYTKIPTYLYSSDDSDFLSTIDSKFLMTGAMFVYDAPVIQFNYQESALPEPPAVTYPASLYAVGNLKGHAWDGKCTEYALAQDAATPGLYKGNITVDAISPEGTGYFKLAAIEGATAANWSEYSYAGKNDGDFLVLDTPTQIWGGYHGEGQVNGNSNAFQIQANGRWDVYEITADLTNPDNMTVTAKLVSTKPAKPIDPTFLKLGEYDSPVDGENCWEGTALNDAPIVFPFCHSGSQVIYTAEQLASIKGEDITSISFKLWATNAYYDYSSTAKIYLNEVDFDTFQKDASDNYRWFEFDENRVRATTVLEIPFYNYTDSDPVEITFDLSEFPYTYDGKNLVVTVVNDAPVAYTADLGTCYFFHVPLTEGAPDRTTIFASDDVDFITNQSSDMYINNQSGNEMSFNYVPVVKIGHSIYTEVEDAVAAQKHSVTTAAGAIVVNLSEAAMVQVYDIAGHAVAAKDLAEGYNTIEVQKGIYIVKIGNEVHKVCVLN